MCVFMCVCVCVGTHGESVVEVKVLLFALVEHVRHTDHDVADVPVVSETRLRQLPRRPVVRLLQV